jgi:hypothetical protein
MRKEKLKNDSFWQAGTLPFVALWAGSYAAAWVGVIALIERLDDIANFSYRETNTIAIAFILIFAALLQVQIVERLLKRSMRGWMLYTALGTVITFFTFYDSSLNGSNHLTVLLTSLSLLVPVPLVQTAWLWRRVKSAWLWPLASIVAAMAFVVPIRDGSGGDEIIIYAALLHGLIQGGVMRHLWMQPRETEKVKFDLAVAAEPIQSSRLQTAETPRATWVYEDDHAAQHKAQ